MTARPEKPVYQNGVHVDADGSLWLRRPNGWYRLVAVKPRPFDGQKKSPSSPVQRLTEVKSNG